MTYLKNPSHSHGGRCPSCGYCPCCGRRDGWHWPWPGPYWAAPQTVTTTVATDTAGTTTWRSADPIVAALNATF